MYKVPEQLLKAVLQYLATRPYVEVFELIKALQSVEKLEETKNENNSISTN